MSTSDLLDALHLQDFQKRTARHVHARMFRDHQKRFLIADEVGLGKTKVAQGVIAMATDRKPSANVLYLACSGPIVAQNLRKLKTKHVKPKIVGSLCLLAEEVFKDEFKGGVRGKLIGLTPIKDLRGDHFGSLRERALLYKLLLRRHRPLMNDPEVRSFFKGTRASSDNFDGLIKERVPDALRDVFEQNVKPELIAKLRDPAERKKHKRAIIGGLRAVLSCCALEKLNPVLVVVDEIQRFSEYLLTDNPTPQAAYLLKRRMLVLSATPYQPGEPGDHASKNPHKGFIKLVAFLNRNDHDTVEQVKTTLEAMRAALQASTIRRAEVQNAVDNLGALLRKFMVRTERPLDAHVERKPIDAPIEEQDLVALRQAMRLLKEANPPEKNKRARHAELIELWKSVPYVVSALGARYVTGRDFASVLRARLPKPATLSTAQLDRKAPLPDPAHPRLRAMIKEIGKDAQQRRLWLPPTQPYIDDPARDDCNPPSKTLVFTSWAAAPPAIATALNLHVELPPARKMQLELTKTRGGERSVPVLSVYVLAAPLWRFAEAGDPFEVMLAAGKPLPAQQMLAGVRRCLVANRHLKVSRVAGDSNVLDTALGLNAEPAYPFPSSKTASYLTPARDLMGKIKRIDQAAVTDANANLLAELAAAGPGTCAFRALRRAIPGLGIDASALFGAAIAIGHSITRLFQRPAAVAIVKGSRMKGKLPYWRQVLRYCLDNDLQSVLDEFVFLLVRDSSEKDPGKLSEEVAEVIDVALHTVGSLQVARPRAKGRAGSGVTIYARALGEHDSDADDGAMTLNRARNGKQEPSRRKGRHANSLLTAFNSPFPPFVLTTTSTGQEGLDMHRYCRRLFHWNLPQSPLALEQREGRIDRYLSLGVRTSIARLGLSPIARDGGGRLIHPWERLLQAAKAQPSSSNSILAPLWHFGKCQPIKAIAINIPFSTEETAWERLLEEASWYRLVLGQPDPQALLERLANGSDDNRQEIIGVRLDLSPRCDEEPYSRHPKLRSR